MDMSLSRLRELVLDREARQSRGSQESDTTEATQQQGICLGVGLLGHMVVLVLVFKGISILSSIVSVSIYIPTNSARIFPFLREKMLNIAHY